MTRHTTGDEIRLGPDEWDDAIAATGGPQLVVAGPGAGKTEFLVRRAAHLVATGVDPRTIVVLTFSRRGAAELTTRIRRSVDPETPAPRAVTFHSLAARIVEAFGEVVGWSEPPALLTGPEQVDLVARLLTEQSASNWPVGFQPLLESRSFAEEVTDFLLRAREYTLGQDDLVAATAGRADWVALPRFDREYDRALADQHRLDYASLILAATRIAQSEEVVDQLARDISHVLVDEYQDTTAAQADFLGALTAGSSNLTVAADPYQSIYSFRGAALENVDRFRTQFMAPDGSPARRVVLTTSFRVPAGILRPAERLTAGDLPGAAGPVSPAGDGGRVDVRVFDQRTHEADWIASELHRLHLVEQIPLQRMAVAVRSTRRLLPDLSRALERRGLPHDRPDSRLVDHPAVRAVADIVSLAADDGSLSEADQRRAARRLLLGPLVGLPLGAEREALRERVGSRADWASVFRGIGEETAALADLIDDGNWATDSGAADGFWHLWSGLPSLTDRCLADDGWRAACTSFSQTLSQLAERDAGTDLASYLRLAEADDFEATPLLRHDPANEDRLVVTTLHQLKGLQFDVVVIADAVDGILPDLRRSVSILNTHLLPEARRDPVEAARFRVQEEMRLAYTAMTRASERVIWTATAEGKDETEDRPSRFLTAVTDRDPALTQTSPRRPVTPLEAEAELRRTLGDPGAPAAQRLAAAAVITDSEMPHLRPIEALPGIREPGPTAGLIPESAAFSPSQAQAFDACPRSYALGRHLGIGDEPSLYMTFGSLVHAVAEHADRAALERGTPATAREALAVLDAKFHPGDFGGPPWSDHWHRRAVEAVENLYTMPPGAGSTPAVVERPLVLEIDGEHWRGRADRIDADDGSLKVIDYKTGKNPASAKDTKESLQLGFYALAAAADPEVAGLGTVDGAELWFPLAAQKRGFATRPFDMANLEGVRERLAEIATSIRREEFPPNVGAACDRCPVRILCDEWPEGREAFVP